MKEVASWFREYSADHQNPTNQKIHLLCVPLITYSVIGFAWCMPRFMLSTLSVHSGWIFIAVMTCFYFLLQPRLALWMLGLALLAYYSFTVLANFVSVLFLSLVIFIVAWVGQFYGHILEGKKPSFFRDLSYLAIGPLWVLAKVLRTKEHNYLGLK